MDATEKAIDAFPGRSVDHPRRQGQEQRLHGPSREKLRQKAKAVLLIGAAAPKIAAQLEGLPLAAIRAPSIERWIGRRRRPVPGDIVLLAPACASFDQFENFEHRGRVFKELVRSL